MPLSVFHFQDYKEFLRARIHAAREEKAFQSRMALAMGCQKSFLSQVLHSKVHLTPDHAIGLCRFCDLSADESEYFLDLLLIGRAGTAALRGLLQRRMSRTRKSTQDPSKKFNWPTIPSSEGTEIYYASWYWSAIHILVSIPQFKTAKAISGRLTLPLATVESSLDWLEKNRLIKKASEGWAVIEARLHLPNTSPMIESHHTNWRQRAIANLQAQDPEAMHYSSVFAMSRQDFAKLKELLVESIASVHRLVEPSTCEELVCFGIDIFRV